MERKSPTIQTSPYPVWYALTGIQPTIVQFFSIPEGLTLPSLGQVNSDTITEARRNRNLQGYRSSNSTNGPERRYCTIWLELTPNVFTVSSAWAGPYEEGEDLLADSLILLEDLQRRTAAD